MNYWLQLFTPYTWARFREHGANISGFTVRQRRTAFERVKPGDLFLCYLVNLSRWCGVLEVTGSAFVDSKPIFAEVDDPYSIRFRVRARVQLDFGQSIPIQEPELWTRLSFTKDLVLGKSGWAQRANLRQSLLKLAPDDGAHISRLLEEQAVVQRQYEVRARHRKHLRIADAKR